jgi:hypothetical protein
VSIFEKTERLQKSKADVTTFWKEKIKYRACSSPLGERNLE